MTVSGLKEALNLTAFALPQGERDVRGGYAGDLLSWSWVGHRRMTPG